MEPIKKKYCFRRYFLFGFGLKEKTKDPRQLNRFISEITNPYSDDNINDVETGVNSNKPNNKNTIIQDKNKNPSYDFNSIDDFIKKSVKNVIILI